MGLGSKEAGFFARLAQGSLGLACQWVRLELDGVGLFNMKQDVIASLARYELPDTLDVTDKLLEGVRQIVSSWAQLDRTTSKSDLTRRAQKTMIQIVISAVYDVMLFHLGVDRPLVNSDQAREIADLARRLDPEQAIERIQDGYEMLRWIEANVAERLIFERLLLRLARSVIIATQS